MSDGFRWHPAARLFDAAGDEVLRAGPPPPSSGQCPDPHGGEGRRPDRPVGAVMPDSAAGLAAAIGHPAFRIGAPDEPQPDGHEVPVLETLTSGSMGRPRRIRRTQGSWTASFAVNAGFGIGPGARVAVPGRLVHSLSLYGAVEGLHLGAEVHLLANLRPDRQRQALADRRITHLYATPAQLRLMLGPGALPDLRLILVGGAKLDSALRAGLAALAPGAELREFYGAAETSFVTLADAATPEASVGRPYPGVELRLDADGTIWVKSPYLFLGYAGDCGGKAGSGAAPSPLVGEGGGGGASAARWREGWLSVGEVGRLEGGCLTLRGRAGRMVTVADQNVFPEEIEGFLLGLPGIARAAVLPVPDGARGQRLVAVVQGDRVREAAILSALRAELGPTRAPKAVVWREDWPVLASGKIDLRALEAGLWPA